AATLLTKASWIGGGVFLALALILSILSSRAQTSDSILREQFQPVPTAPQPVVPGATPEGGATQPEGATPQVPGTTPEGAAPEGTPPGQWPQAAYKQEDPVARVTGSSRTYVRTASFHPGSFTRSNA